MPARICPVTRGLVRVDEQIMFWSPVPFAAALAAEGIPNNPGYIPEPVYMQSLFQERHAYPGSHFPFELSDAHYERGIEAYELLLKLECARTSRKLGNFASRIGEVAENDGLGRTGFGAGRHIFPGIELPTFR